MRRAAPVFTELANAILAVFTTFFTPSTPSTYANRWCSTRGIPHGGVQQGGAVKKLLLLRPRVFGGPHDNMYRDRGYIKTLFFMITHRCRLSPTSLPRRRSLQPDVSQALHVNLLFGLVVLRKTQEHLHPRLYYGPQWKAQHNGLLLAHNLDCLGGRKAA